MPELIDREEATGKKAGRPAYSQHITKNKKGRNFSRMDFKSE